MLSTTFWHSEYYFIWLEIELCNHKMEDFSIIEEFIAWSLNLKIDILTSTGRGKMDFDFEYINIVLKNLSFAIRNFTIVCYNIPHFFKAPTSPN